MINWSKGDSDVSDICKKIRKLKGLKYIYILIVASRDMQDDLINIINAGANDFIFRPFSSQELFSRVRIADNISKLEVSAGKSKKKIMKLVKEDPVTNLMNRRSLMDNILKEMGRASREMKFLTALMTNIRNFESIREKNKIEVIDSILEEFGRRVKSSCRPYDMVGRFGTSEFLLVLLDMEAKDAVKVANRMLSTIVKKEFHVKGQKVKIDLNIGISELNPNEISKENKVDNYLVNDLILDALIKRSEMALKKGMKKSKNSVTVLSS